MSRGQQGWASVSVAAARGRKDMSALFIIERVKPGTKNNIHCFNESLGVLYGNNNATTAATAVGTKGVCVVVLTVDSVI